MTEKRESINVKKPNPPTPHKTLGNTSTITIGVDVSEGIKALKALQREAKETVRLLKEVEEWKAK